MAWLFVRGDLRGDASLHAAFMIDGVE